jgi:hypothetical protein
VLGDQQNRGCKTDEFHIETITVANLVAKKIPSLAMRLGYLADAESASRAISDRQFLQLRLKFAQELPRLVG